MTHTQTIDAPNVAASVDLPADDLTQAELERLIDIARKVKGRRGVGRGTFYLDGGRLQIEGWKRAA
jgi:hypothetical protein